MSHRVRQFSEVICHTYITTPYSDTTGPVSIGSLSDSLRRKQIALTEAEMIYTREKLFLLQGSTRFHWKPEEAWLFLCFLFCTLEHNRAKSRFMDDFIQLCPRQEYSFEFVDRTPTKRQSKDIKHELEERAKAAMNNMPQEQKEHIESMKQSTEEKTKAIDNLRSEIEEEIQTKSEQEIKDAVHHIRVGTGQMNVERVMLYKHAARYPDIVKHNFKTMEEVARHRPQIYKTAMIERASMKRLRETDEIPIIDTKKRKQIVHICPSLSLEWCTSPHTALNVCAMC